MRAPVSKDAGDARRSSVSKLIPSTALLISNHRMHSQKISDRQNQASRCPSGKTALSLTMATCLALLLMNLALCRAEACSMLAWLLPSLCALQLGRASPRRQRAGIVPKPAHGTLVRQCGCRWDVSVSLGFASHFGVVCKGQAKASVPVVIPGWVQSFAPNSNLSFEFE